MTKEYKLYRFPEWTSEGHWAIRRVYEPKFIKRLATTEDLQTPTNFMKDNFEDFSVNKAEYKRLNVSMTISIQSFVPAIRLDGLEKPVWVNPHYLSLFTKLIVPSYDFYGKSPTTPVFVVSVDRASREPVEVIGIVMPVRVTE